MHRRRRGWRWRNKTLIQWLHGSEWQYSCGGLPLRVTDVCLSVALWLSIFAHLTLRDSSCIFITRPDLISPDTGETLSSGTTVTQTRDSEESEGALLTEGTEEKTGGYVARN